MFDVYSQCMSMLKCFVYVMCVCAQKKNINLSEISPDMDPSQISGTLSIRLGAC